MKKIGLSLSGGGYRAAAFHIGTLNKLHQMNILEKVDVMSTISGGSITGAFYCLHKGSYADFSKKMVTLLATRSVIKKILTSFTFIKAVLLILLFLAGSIYFLFTRYPFLSPVILMVLIVLLVIFQFRIFPVSKIVQKAYDSFFYHGAMLQDLNEKPELVIGSTNLQTARPFTFSKNKMEDTKYWEMMDGKGAVYFKHKEFPVSKAVTASSCVPFAFTPIAIEKKYYSDPADFQRINPQLVDGGVYDNQGIHKITQKKSHFNCDIVITSDAGNKIPFEGSYNNTIILLMRTVNVFMARIKNFQMIQNIYRNNENENREVAYFSLGWDLKGCIPGFIENMKKNNVREEVIKAHHIPGDWLNDIESHETAIARFMADRVGYDEIIRKDLTLEDILIARSVGTNLTKLSGKQIDCLVRHAENLTELQVKLYCPSLL
jgi:NTE family protein